MPRLNLISCHVFFQTDFLDSIEFEPYGCSCRVFFAIAATFRECTTDTKINNNHTASFNSMSKNMEYTRMTVSVGHNLSILCYCWKRRFQSKTHTTVWGTTTNPLSNTGCSKIQIIVVSMRNNILYITEYSICRISTHRLNTKYISSKHTP